MNNAAALVSSVLLIALSGALSGCASPPPLAHFEQDFAAKRFQVPAHKVNIYVYRNTIANSVIKMAVTLDGKIAGKIGPKTYFKWTADPGEHIITSRAENIARLSIYTRAGGNYFIRQEANAGLLGIRSEIHEVPVSEGMQGVRQCRLLVSAIE